MILHDYHGSVNVFEVVLVAFAVLSQSQIHLSLDADVINDQPLLLLLIRAIDALDRLNQVVLLDGLVDVHRV